MFGRTVSSELSDIAEICGLFHRKYIMPNVVFRKENGEEILAHLEHGENIMDAALKAQVAIDAPCAGNGTCGKCRLKLLSGSINTAGGFRLSDADYESGWRLACRSSVEGDAAFLVPNSVDAYKTDIRTDIHSDIRSDIRSAEYDEAEQLTAYEAAAANVLAALTDTASSYSQLTVSMIPPTAEDSTPYKERLFSSIKALVQAEDKDAYNNCEQSSRHKKYELQITKTALAALPGAAADGDFTVSCIVRHDYTRSRISILNIRSGVKAVSAPAPTLVSATVPLPVPVPVSATVALSASAFVPTHIPILGLAIDVGTTTVSAILADIMTGKVYAQLSIGNAQIKYGADVINRIIRSTRPGGAAELQKAIIDDTINPLISSLCEKASFSHEKIAGFGNSGNANKLFNTRDADNLFSPDNIVKAVISGNTTMNHLLLGIPANSIRLEPYVPVFSEIQGLTAFETELNIHPDAEIVITPNVGSYVGGDITTGVLASGMWDRDEITLLIDLGTNGELVLGNRDFLVCCACSAGPAFEGGDISCGMRATTGAIDSCVIDEQTMEPTLSVIGSAGTKPAGLCGSGLISTISELFRCGSIDSKGKFIADGPRIKRGEYGASYIVAYGSRTDLDTENCADISLTEIDIDNFIRAKGAIFSAILTMLNSLDMKLSSIDKIIIAGGIGKGIDIKKAITIGMLPDLPLEKYEYIGNSSLIGSFAVLLSAAAEEKMTQLKNSMTYLELSSSGGYMDEFIAACFLPHTNANLFTSLKNGD